ncbi:hypothetical protein Y1Q_0024454 [Alligator mississippiensis]|uniref:Uncharacterized protein n=1 Tax=Alligator mississippiensis TaxID=8496 RepID=A0A151N779_ALLMI|nr:hypothetical protein Y1Q_0024454 [Alligator mississippiensis]
MKSVSHDGVDIHYAVHDSSLEVHLDRFHTSPERAKLANMTSERDHLHTSGLMTAELEGLFDMAMERLSKELADIKDYASMTVQWGTGEMTFRQELEDYLITVPPTNSGTHHLTKPTTVLGYLKCLCHHPEKLNDGKLLEIQDTLKGLQGLRDEWKSSLELAQRQFRHEPVWGFMSLGMWHYQVEVPSGEIYKERLYAQPKPLSIGHLVTVKE